VNVLALEASGKIISIALKLKNQSLELTVDRGFRHVETLMPSVETLMNLAGIEAGELDLVACSAGPGSFTALRIGMSTAKGIAKGASCALKAVPTLPLLASGREHWPGIVVPVMDARKKRVYTAAFKQGVRIRKDEDISLTDFLDSLPDDEKILVTGPDAGIAADYKGVVLDPMAGSGRGLSLIEMAVRALDSDGPDPSDLGPLYLRLSEAEEALGTAG